MTEAVVVTGAAGALGRVVAARLMKAGYAIAAIDRHAHGRLDAGSIELDGIDLTDEAATAHAFAAIASRFGTIRGLVNIAGAFAWGKIADGSRATWDRLYALNVLTAVNASRAAIPLLGAGGSIVNIGAAAATHAGAGMAAYATAKSGVARLTEALAVELLDRRLRVNAILPSMIDTPANRADMPDADFAAWVTPAEIANVIAFLLSDEASGITGAAIPVTGRV
jgi:NAD(P)-dependent dehydrogenase (short-subunit alcohol dehydrogenase family)